MIQCTRDGEYADTLRPQPGRWTITVVGVYVCEVDVTAELIDEWGRRCALDVAWMLPAGCDPVVREWLETGDEGLRSLACTAVWDAARHAVGPPRAARDAVWEAAWEGEPAAHAAREAVWEAAWVNAWETAWADAWAAGNRAAAAAKAAAAADKAAAAARDAAEVHQADRFELLILRRHAATLSPRAKVRLARELRRHGFDDAAAVVLPIDLQEVTA